MAPLPDRAETFVQRMKKKAKPRVQFALHGSKGVEDSLQSTKPKTPKK